MFGGNFAPANWMFCNGQLLPISQYETLFNLIGTTYGGDGQSTFALPDLRGRFPLHQGSEFPLGQIAGAETVTLTLNQIPQHSHLASCSAVGSVQGPAGSYWSTDPAGNTAAYSDQAANSEMASTAIASTGGNQPHDNRQPYLAVSFIIALFGIYPSQS
jgi:microcystin-dependent protein